MFPALRRPRHARIPRALRPGWPTPGAADLRLEARSLAVPIFQAVAGSGDVTAAANVGWAAQNAFQEDAGTGTVQAQAGDSAGPPEWMIQWINLSGYADAATTSRILASTDGSQISAAAINDCHWHIDTSNSGAFNTIMASEATGRESFTFVQNGTPGSPPFTGTSRLTGSFSIAFALPTGPQVNADVLGAKVDFTTSASGITVTGDLENGLTVTYPVDNGQGGTTLVTQNYADFFRTGGQVAFNFAAQTTAGSGAVAFDDSLSMQGVTNVGDAESQLSMTFTEGIGLAP
jgi:hypothetical protein